MNAVKTPQTILVFRRGSIGDGVISLPVLAAARQRWPDCRFLLLTNEPVARNAAPMMQLLAGEPGIDGGLDFPAGLTLQSALKLVRQIRQSDCDFLLYLSEPGNVLTMIRDWVFFRCLAGLPVRGLPIRKSDRFYRQLSETEWERETDRLLRACDLGPDIPDSWRQLHLSNDEAARGRRARIDRVGDRPFIALATRAKTSDKDWGDDRWSQVLSALAKQRPERALILIGAASDKDQLDRLSDGWPGPVANLCGIGGPRDSAAAMQGADLFLGVDSGPMHLAAAVGVPCVAVFSARAKPGVWYPFGAEHKIHYPEGGADRIPAMPGAHDGGNSIRGISPAEVIASARSLLDAA